MGRNYSHLTLDERRSIERWRQANAPSVDRVSASSSNNLTFPVSSWRASRMARGFTQLSLQERRSIAAPANLKGVRGSYDRHVSGEDTIYLQHVSE